MNLARFRVHTSDFSCRLALWLTYWFATEFEEDTYHRLSPRLKHDPVIIITIIYYLFSYPPYLFCFHHYPHWIEFCDKFMLFTMCVDITHFFTRRFFSWTWPFVVLFTSGLGTHTCFDAQCFGLQQRYCSNFCWIVHSYYLSFFCNFCVYLQLHLFLRMIMWCLLIFFLEYLDLLFTVHI